MHQEALQHDNKVL